MKYVEYRIGDSGGKLDVSLLGRKIGRGNEGEVYSYGRGRVCKLVYFRGAHYPYEEADRVYERLRRLRRVARIYSWGKLEGGDYGWYVIMERLRKMSDGEKRLVNDCGMDAKGEVGRFFRWLDRLPRLGLSYGDLHGGNVMVGECGRLKICDLDGFSLEGL